MLWGGEALGYTLRSFIPLSLFPSLITHHSFCLFCLSSSSQGFQKEITLNTDRIDALIVFGEALIQCSCPPDAAHIEDELVELHTYCQEVFRRAARFHQRLTNPHPVRLTLSGHSH